MIRLEKSRESLGFWVVSIMIGLSIVINSRLVALV